MSIGLIILLLIISFFAIGISLSIEKEKAAEKKRLQEAERKKSEDLAEMKKLKLDEKGYKLYKLRKTNDTYLLDKNLRAIIPVSIAIHKARASKKVLVSFDAINHYKIWDQTDNKLIFLLFNCSEIACFDSVDYDEIIYTYCDGQFKNLLAYEFRQILVESFKAKTVQLKSLLEKNHVTEAQTVRGLISVNFDKEAIREIQNNSTSIFSYKQDIERIDNWLFYKSDGGQGAANWATRKENEINKQIDFIYATQEAKGICYLYEHIKTQGKLNVIVKMDENRQVVTKEALLSI